MMKNLNYKTIIDVLQKYNGDILSSAIELNMSYSKLHYYITSNNIPYVKRKKEIAGKEQIKEAYERLGSLSLVAKELGGTKEGIRCAMQRYELQINSLVRRSCNENFFSESNEESFYWAGFLAADGCVKIRDNTYELSLALSEKDLQHLEKFKTAIQATNSIGIYTVKNSLRNPKWNDTTKCEMTIASKKIFENLSIFNIVPRKTKIYSFPYWILQTAYYHHFIRGYIDGDGCFRISDGKNIKQVNFNLLGTQKFLMVIQKILENECNIPSSDTKVKICNNISSISYGGNIIVSKIVDFLYKDATIYLPRKYEIAMKAKEFVFHSNRDQINKELLEKLYNELGTQKAIGKYLGYSSSRICQLMKEYNITK